MSLRFYPRGELWKQGGNNPVDTPPERFVRPNSTKQNNWLTRKE